MARYLTAYLWVMFFFTSVLSAQDTIRVAAKNSRWTSIIEEWQKTPRSGDTAFVEKYSDVGQDGPVAFHEGSFLPGSMSAVKKAKKGDVLGPYESENADYILRINGRGVTCDSVQVAHILISWQGCAAASPDIKRTKEQARKTADSLVREIKSGRTIFEDVVVQMTDDPGSKSGNLGNYGWFTRESGFVKPFKNAGFDNPVGSTVVVETDFGFHVIQVKKKTKEYNCYYAWQIVKIIDTCYLLDGVTRVLHLGGFPGGDSELKILVEKERYKYSSIAEPKTQGRSVMVLFDIKPDGFVGDVRLSFDEDLSEQQRADIILLFRSLPPFIAARTCDEVIGQTEMFFFYY